MDPKIKTAPDENRRPASNASPNARQAARERAEAMAMAEVESEARKRRERSEQLRKLRLAQNKD